MTNALLNEKGSQKRDTFAELMMRMGEMHQSHVAAKCASE